MAFSFYVWCFRKCKDDSSTGRHQTAGAVDMWTDQSHAYNRAMASAQTLADTGMQQAHCASMVDTLPRHDTDACSCLNSCLSRSVMMTRSRSVTVPMRIRQMPQHHVCNQPPVVSWHSAEHTHTHRAMGAGACGPSTACHARLWLLLQRRLRVVAPLQPCGLFARSRVHSAFRGMSCGSGCRPGLLPFTVPCISLGSMPASVSCACSPATAALSTRRHLGASPWSHHILRVWRCDGEPAVRVRNARLDSTQRLGSVRPLAGSRSFA